LLLGFYILRTIFSDSIGLSITATLRLFMGFTVFYIFAVYLTGPKLLQFFLNILTLISTIASLIALIFLAFPPLAANLPPMNLLYPYFGHHHLPSLLFFTFPYVLSRCQGNKSKLFFVSLILYAFIFLLSFSKSALIVLAVYFVISFIISIKSRQLAKVSINFGIATIATLSLILILLFSSSLQLQRFVPDKYLTWFTPQVDKSPSFLESRAHYWQQAWDGFKTNPLFGRGPGTFYLISRRFQQNPDQNSYFAHSWPLEQLSETGIVGIALWLLLFFSIYRKIHRHLQSTSYNLQFNYRNSPLTTHNSQLITGIFMVLGLSLIDFNLNFIVSLLLLFAFLGMLNSSESTNIMHKKKRFNFFMLLITFCGLYYFTSMTSMVASQQKDNQLALLFAPYDRFRTIAALNSSKNQTEFRNFSLTNFFHSRDPDVLFGMANTPITRSTLENFLAFYAKAIINDPKNFAYYKEYLEKSASYGSAQEKLNALIFSSSSFLNDNSLNEIKKISASEEDIQKNFNPQLINQLTNEPSEYYFAKLYYSIGLNVLDKNPELTRLFWEYSSRIYPGVGKGLLYHELAALALYIFDDNHLSTLYIQKCMKIPAASIHCRNIKPDHSNLPPPGSVKDSVINYRE
ncbi:MAG: O-antigen ligase family protein, partial [Patescibacteria group bacterium]